MIQQYAVYLVRWQLSTPILAGCLIIFNERLGPTWATVLANLVGGLMFFWIDRWIFGKRRS